MLPNENWDTNWDRINEDTQYQSHRKMVHKNGGNFLCWTAMKSEDGSGYYVAAVVGKPEDRPIIWGPRLADEYLRLVPDPTSDQYKVSVLTSAIRDAVLDMDHRGESNPTKRKLEKALTSVGVEI